MRSDDDDANTSVFCNSDIWANWKQKCNFITMLISYIVISETDQSITISFVDLCTVFVTWVNTVYRHWAVWAVCSLHSSVGADFMGPEGEGLEPLPPIFLPLGLSSHETLNNSHTHLFLRGLFHAFFFTRIRFIVPQNTVIGCLKPPNRLGRGFPPLYTPQDPLDLCDLDQRLRHSTVDDPTPNIFGIDVKKHWD